MAKEIICNMIEIKGSMTRREIVQKVINTFIDTEDRERGKGVRFLYPVERLWDDAHPSLPDGKKLFIFRPAGLRKWNFDFKVDVTPEMGLEKGRHEDIASDLRKKRHENPEEFNRLLYRLWPKYTTVPKTMLTKFWGNTPI
jgi:hypothetical protein